MKKDKNVIVITGASSGFGALAARALARAGHTVYASMRETTGRNAPQVAAAQTYAADHASISAPSSSMSPPRPPPPLRSNRSSPRTVAWTW
jgi:NAD(P)-dependent dehydrogenase (short-subunit alcohol dehydrogenase family)